ncbi:MAG: hypothetical protein R8G34_15980 [Paracoccaceae bacterium]|nr:hypothetical protein [Paracoccaceae bacterium]
MVHKSDPKKQTGPKDARADRLKAALKANLARRKAQSRARSDTKGAQTGTPAPTGSQKDA